MPEHMRARVCFQKGDDRVGVFGEDHAQEPKAIAGAVFSGVGDPLLNRHGRDRNLQGLERGDGKMLHRDPAGEASQQFLRQGRAQQGGQIARGHALARSDYQQTVGRDAADTAVWDHADPTDGTRAGDDQVARAESLTLLGALGQLRVCEERGRPHLAFVHVANADQAARGHGIFGVLRGLGARVA